MVITFISSTFLIPIPKKERAKFSSIARRTIGENANPDVEDITLLEKGKRTKRRDKVSERKEKREQEKVLQVACCSTMAKKKK